MKFGRAVPEISIRTDKQNRTNACRHGWQEGTLYSSQYSASILGTD